MDYRLLALDIDGTLANARGEITKRVQSAVRAAAERGIEVVLCSGRRIRTLRPVAEALGLKGPAIVQNGASVRRLGDDARLRECFLAPAVVQAAWSLLERSAPPLAYVDDPALPDVDLLYLPPERPPELSPERARGDTHAHQRRYLERWAAVARPISAGDELTAHPVVMLSCMADETTLLKLRTRVDAELGAHVRTDVIANAAIGGAILELRAHDAGKWSALAWLADDAGIRHEEIVAIGDDHNDIEMLEGAGLGIAMESAPAEVLAAADATTGSHAADGVADAIERHLLAD